MNAVRFFRTIGLGFRSGDYARTTRRVCGTLGRMMQAQLNKMIESLFIAPLTSIPPRVVESDRLALRAISEGDGQRLFDLYANDVVASRYMSFKVTGRVDESEAFARSVGDFFNGKTDVPIRQFSWLIQEKSSGELIGSAGFGPLNDTTLSGGYILNRAFWGKGYASEVWKRLVQIAQADPGVQRIEAYHHPENPASGKVMLHAGMTCEGIRPLGAVYPNISEERIPDIIYAWNRK